MTPPTNTEPRSSTEIIISALHIIARDLEFTESAAVCEAAGRLEELDQQVRKLQGDNKALKEQNQYLLAGLIPGGWVLVPEEPTNRMKIAGIISADQADNRSESDFEVGIYRAMLASAPSPQRVNGMTSPALNNTQTVYVLVDADAEQESNHYPHDIPRFKPEWVDVPWSLAVQCTFVPGRLQQEFADGVAVMANEIFRVFAGDGSEACDTGACKAIGAVMPGVFQEMKKIDKEVE